MQTIQANTLLGGPIFDEYRDLLSASHATEANFALALDADSGNPQCSGGGGRFREADSGNPQCSDQPGGRVLATAAWIDLPRN